MNSLFLVLPASLGITFNCCTSELYANVENQCDVLSNNPFDTELADSAFVSDDNSTYSLNDELSKDDDFSNFDALASKYNELIEELNFSEEVLVACLKTDSTNPLLHFYLQMLVADKNIDFCDTMIYMLMSFDLDISNRVFKEFIKSCAISDIPIVSLKAKSILKCYGHFLEN